MKISKKEILEITKRFNLGSITSYKSIKGGLVNFNYILKTNKGKYIVRIVGENSNSKIKHLKIQFEILDFLKKENFPYLIPQPLETNNSKKIVNLNKKMMWVYEMIEGANRDRPNLLQMKQMAKALAIYHKYIKKFKSSIIKDDSKKRILEGFKKMEYIKGKTESDRLALKYKDYFKNLFLELKNTNYSLKNLFVHGDFDSSNVLFHNKRLNAIIDFDDVSYEPRIFDVAVSLRDSCCTRGRLDIQKSKIFLKEYEKISKLSKKEKKRIIPIILYANIDFFVWSYVYMKKDIKNIKIYMKEMVILTKDIIENNKENIFN